MIVVVVRNVMQLFCAFSSTKVWYFNAFIVGNLQEQKTFTCISYNVQKNTVARNKISSFTKYVLSYIMFARDQHSIQKKFEVSAKRDHKERCAVSIFCGNKF